MARTVDDHDVIVLSDDEEDYLDSDSEDIYSNYTGHTAMRVLKNKDVIDFPIHEVSANSNVSEDLSLLQCDSIDNSFGPVEEDGEVLQMKKRAEENEKKRRQAAIERVDNFCKETHSLATARKRRSGEPIVDTTKAEEYINQVCNSDLPRSSPGIRARRYVEHSKGLKNEEDKEEEVITIMLRDFEHNSSKAEKLFWPFNSPFSGLRQKIADKWSCSPEQVLISMTSRGKDISLDGNDSAESLGLPIEEVVSINAILLSLKNEVDNSTILLKIQRLNCRPVEVRAAKDETFGEMRQRLVELMKLSGPVKKILFDDEEVGNEETPTTLGMEDGDCLDLYL